MAYIPNTGSVVAFQGNPSVLQATVGINSTNASVITVATPAANQSVSGTVGASVLGHAPVVIVGGSILTSSTPNQSVSGTVGASIIGTVPTTQTGVWISSIVNTVPSSVLVGASLFGQLPGGTAVLGSVAALQGTNPWVVVSSVTGGLFPISGSVAATITNTNINVSGSVAAFQAGTRVTSLVSTVPSSVIVGTSIFGQLPAGTAPLGSVAVLQGTNPWINTNVGSIITTNIGSVISVTQGSVAAIRAGQIGTVITSISGIPQASIHGAVTFLPASVVSGHGSVNGVASVQILAAPGTGLYNYVTDILLSNTGAATTLVSITDGDASILSKLIAPTGGGAVATSLSSPIKAGKINGVINISSATATSVLHAWLGGYKAP